MSTFSRTDLRILRKSRNKVHLLGQDLTGVWLSYSRNCRTWEMLGSRDDDNRELLERSGCYTIQPKGILINRAHESV